MDRRKFLKTTGLAAGSAADAGQPGDRPDGARDEMAADLELPESARHDLRRRHVLAKAVAEITDGKFQIQRLRRPARSCPAFGASTPCRTARSRSATPRRYYFFGKDPTFALRLRDAVRPEQPPAERLDVSRRRPRADARVLRGLQHHQLPRRQHRRADGRLVPQGDQDGRRPQGPEDAHRRLRPAKVLAQARRRAAADPRRRHLSGAREGHDRRRRMGRPLRRREARLLQGRARTTTTPAGGRAARSSHFFVNTRQWNELPKRLPGDPRRRPAPRPTSTCMAKYDALQPAGAASGWSPTARKLRPFSHGHHGRLLQGGAARSTPRSTARTRRSRRSTRTVR